MYNSIFYDFKTNQSKRAKRQLLAKSIVYLLFFVGYLGFANPVPVSYTNKAISPNAEESILGVPCSQVTIADIPNILKAPFTWRIAFDVPVSQGNTFELKTLKAQILENGSTPTFFNLFIYDGTSSSPTTLISTHNSISHTSRVSVVNNVYEYTFDISSFDITLDAPSESKTYWIALESDAEGWRGANTQIGFRIRGTDNGGASWFMVSADVDVVYELIGECTGCSAPLSTGFDMTSFTAGLLTWSDPNISGATFDVEWGEEGFTPTQSGSQYYTGITTFSQAISSLTPGTDYEFYVRTNCGGGESAWVKSEIFRTEYCQPVSAANCNTNNVGISKVEIKDVITPLNKDTSNPICGTNGYANFTSTEIWMSEDQTASVEVNITALGGIKLWADWNKNGVFEANELLTESIGTLTGLWESTFTIPTNTPFDDYRLRIRFVYPTDDFGPCGDQTYSDVQDYTLKVIPTPTCMFVSDQKATNTSANTTLLEWTSDGDLFEIEYGPNGFTQGSGTTITGITETSYVISGLVAGDMYQYYVRRDCGNGDQSVWRGPVSFIPGNYDQRISSRLSTNPQVTSQACGATFNIDVPAGKQIASLKVEYAMTSVNPRFISQQRSVLYSPTLNAGETSIVSGNSSNDFPGVENYIRFVDFANGATGTVVFELKTWRVAGNAGCTDDEIFVPEGTWILTPTFDDVPACPNPPTDLGYNLISESSVELFWTEGEANATHQLKYGNVGFDVDTSGTLEDNLTTNSLTLTGLDQFDAYEFYVRRDCGAGDFSDWVGPTRFNSGYCLPYSSIAYYLTAFSTTNAIENVTYTYSTPDTTGYINNTANIIEQEAGQSFDFSANYIGGASGLRIWIDWNNDFIFDDTEEVFYLGSASGGKTGTIDIPQNTLSGDYRMRIRAEQGASSIPPACDVIGFGEAIDFVLRIPCPTIATPTGEASQTFTAGQTIADLVVNGTDLVWYSDSALTLAIPTTTELVHNTTYYVVSESGICQSSALEITAIDCTQVVSTPTGEASQTFTAGQTIADLVVSGTNLVWYSDSALTLAIPTTTELVNNTIYYVVNEIGVCKSSALEITAIDCSLVVSTPTGEASQTFTAGQTIADLVVDGTYLVFYNSTYTETFSLTDQLIDGAIYYVVNEVSGCMSDPLIITVTEFVSRSDFDVYGFRYHPNPVNDILYFSTNTAIENVVVSNMLGQQINANVSSDKTSLDMSNLPSGNYFVKVTIEGISKTIKIIKI